MKHKWKGIELDVGTAMPMEAQSLPKHGRRKYLRCPLCFEACADGYWSNYHSKNLHLQCPLCLGWFAKKQGLSMHLTRSQCGYEILQALEHLETNAKREIIIRVV